jgi:PAS domain S-box-containing protein
LHSFNFTRRYILALTIIALLSTLAYFNLDKLITTQYSCGKIINISGQQRMLSQQISLHAIYYKAKALKANIKKMEQNHNFLINSPMSDELKKIYFGKEIIVDENKKDYINEISKRVKSDYIQEPVALDKKVKEYLSHAKNFLERRSGNSLTYLLTHSKPLLKDLDRATLIYVKEAQNNTNTLKRVELFIFILTIITLILEALFIFRPANRQIVEDRKIITNEKDYSNSVIDSSANAIITLNSNLEIKKFNKMAQEIFKYSKDEVVGTRAFFTMVPFFKDIKHINELLEKIKNKNLSNPKELNRIDKDGDKFPIKASFGVSKSEKDIIIIANIQNIAKEKLKDKIVQEQAKFAALGEMIAVIAHQWRQPLAQLNFNNLYIKKLTKNKEIEQEIKNNEEIIQFMSETITNFEDFYKKSQEIEFKPATSIEQALKIVDSIIKLKEIKVTKKIDSKALIYGNPNALAQVVLSILQNSLDVIKLRDIKEAEICIEIYDTKESIVIKIEDNAGGIDEKPIENIFKPFISKKRVKSTGIGLYMSQMVIKEKFNGKIEAKNSSKGAIFIITIPF